MKLLYVDVVRLDIKDKNMPHTVSRSVCYRTCNRLAVEKLQQ